MILPRLKRVSQQGFASYIVAGVYFKESSVFMIGIMFHNWTNKCAKLLRKIFCTCACSVHQASPRGGGAWGQTTMLLAGT